ncbi:MAG: fibronectin type III domain-containing protein [Candidatus Nanopelagicales bacterium]
MRAHRASRMGVAVLSVVALVASGASPIAAVPVPAVVVPSSVLTMPVRGGGLAVDASGSVYVAGYGAPSNQVSVFDAGVALRNEARTLTGLSGPWDVAIHPVSGEILVSNYAVNTVSVFNGTGVLNRTLVGVPNPTGLAVTASGVILVGSWSNHAVYVFEGTNTHASRTIETTVPAAGIAVDPVWNFLYVAHPAIDAVRVYNVETGAPEGGWGIPGVDEPYDVALQLPTGMFYVSEWAANAGTLVKAFARGTSVADPATTLAGVTGPWGVAVSPANGAVYVTDAPNDVHVYPSVVSSVSGVDPSTGPVTGGTAVSIKGTNLGAVTQVTFNGVVAEQTDPALPTSIPVKVPAATLAGPVTVQVKWAGNIAGKADAFTYTAVAPGTATEVFGTRGNQQVTVSWKAPAFTGGVPIASYLVTPSPSGAPCSTTGTSCTIGGLTNGTPYTFTVTTTNTASLSSVSAPSPAVTPVIALSLKVKAKKASYRPGRWGTRTLVSWAKKPSNANRMVTRKCTNGTGIASSKLCKFTVYKSGKVKVRTRGYRNVVITVSIVSTPKSSAGPMYGPSPTWTRTWRAK